MDKLTCAVCGTEIKGSYLKSNVNLELKPAEEGTTVCSNKCAEECSEKFRNGGNAIQHWSRITGYYQNVSGWNKGKIAELHDRKRFDI
jgi:hypothetical protein